MKSSGALPIDQHNVEIRRNGAAWTRKPGLRQVYAQFYQKIAACIDPKIPGAIVELGSGLGKIKEVIPQCITTDVFPNPWLDRQENAYALNFPDHSISHLILFDVWHHLRYPGTALREFHRVLAPGGRLILFEPAASWTGRMIYHFFHHEPVGLKDPISWDAPPGFRPADADYFAAQGNATRLFWWGEARGKLAGWRLTEVKPLTSFEYFASGGFSGPQFGGAWLSPVCRAVDRLAAICPRVFAVRLLVVMEKETP